MKIHKPGYHIYLPTKCTFLISTNIKGASPKYFGTNCTEICCRSSFYVHTN